MTTPNKDGLASPHFVVDSDLCMACEICVNLASDFFQMNPDRTFALVHRHPKNAVETAICHDARTQCPVDAIAEI